MIMIDEKELVGSTSTSTATCLQLLQANNEFSTTQQPH
jgi:hypothetical protein